MRVFQLLSAILVVTGMAGCTGQADTLVPPAALPQPVVTATPVPVPDLERVRAIGRLEALDEVSLAFKTGGVVAQVLVDIGDQVKAGQVLARLESTEVDADVRRAREALGKAERDLSRAQRIFAQKLVSQEILDNARTSWEVAETNLKSAQFNQTYATIVAPANGRVLSRLVKSREIVAAGQPVLAVSGEGKGWLLRVSVADRDAVRLGRGTDAKVSFDAWPGRSFNASISRIAGMADARTGTFDVELAIDVQDVFLRSGLIGRAELDIRDPAEGFAVPVAALVDANRTEGTLFVVRDGKAVMLQVELGRLVGEHIAVTRGLGADDAVIVSGAPYVDDGHPVRLVSR